VRRPSTRAIRVATSRHHRTQRRLMVTESSRGGISEFCRVKGSRRPRTSIYFALALAILFRHPLFSRPDLRQVFPALTRLNRLPTGTLRMPIKATRLLPCLSCRHGEMAIEEAVGIYLAALHGERPPPKDGRPLQFLPRMCCRQEGARAPEVEVASLIA
jgi:hypothetical protein